MIGFDLDGVIAAPWWTGDTREAVQLWYDAEHEYKARLKMLKMYWNCKPLYVPKKPGIIITNRTNVFRDLTKRWLFWHNIPYTELITAPGWNDGFQRATYKIEHIIKRGVSIYYEDEPELIEAMQPWLRNCKVHPPDLSVVHGNARAYLLGR